MATFSVEMLVVHGLAGRVADGLIFLLVPLTHLLLIPFLWVNRGLWGSRLVAVGLGLNLLAMAANGGLMPVQAEAVDQVGRHDSADLSVGAPIPGSKNYYAGEGGVRLEGLSDTISVDLPFGGVKALSAGDFFVLTGVAMLYVQATVQAGLWRQLFIGTKSSPS